MNAQTDLDPFHTRHFGGFVAVNCNPTRTLPRSARQGWGRELVTAATNVRLRPGEDDQR